MPKRILKDLALLAGRGAAAVTLMLVLALYGLVLLIAPPIGQRLRLPTIAAAVFLTSVQILVFGSGLPSHPNRRRKGTSRTTTDDTARRGNVLQAISIVMSFLTSIYGINAGLEARPRESTRPPQEQGQQFEGSPRQSGATEVFPQGKLTWREPQGQSGATELIFGPQGDIIFEKPEGQSGATEVFLNSPSSFDPHGIGYVRVGRGVQWPQPPTTELSDYDVRQLHDNISAGLELADFSGAHLEKAELGGANLERATFNGAHLAQANLAGALLNDASLRGADLKGARLEGASLTRADLSGAELDGADLKGADLSHAKGLSQAQLSTVTIDASTILPSERADS